MPLYHRIRPFVTRLCSQLEAAFHPSCFSVSDLYLREVGDYGFVPAASADLDDTTPLQGEN